MARTNTHKLDACMNFMIYGKRGYLKTKVHVSVSMKLKNCNLGKHKRFLRASADMSNSQSEFCRKGPLIQDQVTFDHEYISGSDYYHSTKRYREISRVGCPILLRVRSTSNTCNTVGNKRVMFPGNTLHLW